jgi:tartrate dehydratase beta subunit/fumarate hydratase class I family protein
MVCCCGYLLNYDLNKFIQVVARDIAHAKISERLEAGQGLPEYIKDYMVYYAGPAKTPEGYASGSFGPTTAGNSFQKSSKSITTEIVLC